jgi:hypothetical protein
MLKFIFYRSFPHSIHSHVDLGRITMLKLLFYRSFPHSIHSDVDLGRITMFTVKHMSYIFP